MRCCVFALAIVAASLTVAAQQRTPYKHPKTGVVFDPPENWNYVRTVQLLDGGDQIQWFVPDVDVTVYAWIIDEANDPAEIERRLDAAIETKIAQRRSAKYRNYDIRPETVRRIEVNGHPAITAVAQFDTGGKQRVSESVAWVMSSRAHLFLFAPAKTEQATAILQPQFDRFLTSIQLP